MNLLEIQQEVGRLLSDPNNDRWSTTIITARANQAQIEIQGFTNAIKTPETLTPTANVSQITLDSDTMDIIRAYKTLGNGEIKPLIGKNREELDFLFPDWRQWFPGEPIYFFYDATNQQLNLVPAPDSQNAITNGIIVYESRKPAPLVNSTDIPFDANNQMVPYHMAIVHWVVAYCWMDDATPESLAKAKFHRSGNELNPGQYELQIARIVSEFDSPEAIPSSIMFQPEGGRIGGWGVPSKAYPLTF